jgi:hypothetical protein
MRKRIEELEGRALAEKEDEADPATARVVVHDLPRERLVIEPEEDFIIIRREACRRGEWRDTEEEAVYVHADAVRELGQALIQVAARQVL